jgi:hypothetical protein
MGSSTVDEVIERIRNDRAFAQSVADEGTPALGGYELSDAERASLVEAFRQDLEMAAGEVRAFDAFPGNLSVPNLMSMGHMGSGGGAGRNSIGSATTGAGAGKAEFGEFTLTRW